MSNAYQLLGNLEGKKRENSMQHKRGKVKNKKDNTICSQKKGKKYEQSLEYLRYFQNIDMCILQTFHQSTTYLPMRMSNVRTVPSTLPPIISVFVKQTDITLSKNVSIICKQNSILKKISYHTDRRIPAEMYLVNKKQSKPELAHCCAIYSPKRAMIDHSLLRL